MKNKKIFVAQPKMAGNEKNYVMDCLDSNWISSNGKYITKFEESFAEFCGVRNAVATNNGTTALHLALVALGLGPGDEVIIPTVTYIATANAVRYCGATPVLADVLPGTLNIDPNAIKEKITAKTKGIIVVHLYGHPAAMKEIQMLTKEHGLFLLEDAAEAHGAEYKGSRVGSFGDCATFSFFGNKIITTGEGGMVTTNDDALAERLRLYRGQGMDSERRYWFPVIGYNYRMTNIQAAIGLAQMEKAEEMLQQRQLLAQWYHDALKCLEEYIILPEQDPNVKHAYWMYNIFLKEGVNVSRDVFMETLQEHGIETRPVFYPLHIMPPYFEDSIYPVANKWAQQGVNLPTHLGVSKEHVDQITQAMQKVLA